MRLVVVSDSFHPREGGAERQLRHVGAALVAAHGWEVAVVARQLDGSRTFSPLDGLTVHRVGPAGTGRVATAAATVVSARTAAGLHPDVLVGVQLGASAAAAVMASRLAPGRPPVVLRLTGGTLDGTELEQAGRSPLRRRVTGVVLADCRVVVAPAQHLLERPGPFGPEMRAKGLVIPNGAPAMPPPGTGPRTEVVWVGRPDPVKRLDQFLAVAAGNPDHDHVVIGPVAAALSAGAPANVRATGWLDDPVPVLSEAAVLVSTSDFEGHPNAAVEALQLGVPVVAWDIAAFRELAGMADGLVHLVPRGDVTGMAAVVRRVAVGGQRSSAVGLPTLADVAVRWDGLLQELCEYRSAATVAHG